MAVQTVALLTAGGFAPCLSSAVGGLIERYTEIAPDVGSSPTERLPGLLIGDSVEVTPEVRENAALLHALRRLARSATAGSSSPTSRTA